MLICLLGLWHPAGRYRKQKTQDKRLRRRWWIKGFLGGGGSKGKKAANQAANWQTNKLQMTQSRAKSGYCRATLSEAGYCSQAGTVHSRVTVHKRRSVLSSHLAASVSSAPWNTVNEEERQGRSKTGR
jgi:hypothetical protein